MRLEEMAVVPIKERFVAVEFVENCSAFAFHRSQYPEIGPLRYCWPICTIAGPSVSPSTPACRAARRRRGPGTLADLLAVMQTDQRLIEVALREVAIRASFLDQAA